MGQVASYREYGCLDGRAALPAAALRLSRDGTNRLGPVGDLQNHGASSAAGDHDSGDVRDLGFRFVVGGYTGACGLAHGVDVGKARARHGPERISLCALTMARCLQRRQQQAFDTVFSDRQRAANVGNDSHRASRRGEAVLIRKVL